MLPQGVLRKIVLRFFDKLFAALVFEVVSRTLHIQKINPRPAIAL